MQKFTPTEERPMPTISTPDKDEPDAATVILQLDERNIVTLHAPSKDVVAEFVIEASRLDMFKIAVQAVVADRGTEEADRLFESASEADVIDILNAPMRTSSPTVDIEQLLNPLLGTQGLTGKISAIVRTPLGYAGLVQRLFTIETAAQVLAAKNEGAGQ